MSIHRLAIIAICTVGCAHARVPAYLVDDALEPPDYPSAAYLTASAQSSAGASEADDAARLALLRQVQSRVRGVVESLETQSLRDGRVTHEVRQRQQLFVETEFAHAEFVRIAQRHADGDVHYALAVLERGRAVDALLKEYRAASDELRGLCASQQDSASLLVRGLTLSRRASQLGWSLAALGDASADDPETRRCLESLDVRRRAFLASHPLRVEAQTPEASDAVGPVVQALAQLGVVTGGGESAGRLQLGVVERFPRGLELCCERTFSFSLDGRPIGTAPITVTACDLRDEGRARAAATLQFGEMIEEPLQSALAPLMPIDQSR